MNKIITLLLLTFTLTTAAQQQIIIGLKTPQLDSVQRSSIITDNHATLTGRGQLVYNKQSNCLEYWNGTKWVSLCDRAEWFYLPSFNLDVSEEEEGKEVNLYEEYKNQFSKSGNTSYVVSDNDVPDGTFDYATNKTLFPLDKLTFVVTDYDETAIKVNSINAQGIMNYDVLKTDPSPAAYINIVCVVEN